MAIVGSGCNAWWVVDSINVGDRYRASDGGNEERSKSSRPQANVHLDNTPREGNPHSDLCSSWARKNQYWRHIETLLLKL